MAIPGDRACSGQNGSFCCLSAYASCQKMSQDPSKVRRARPQLPVGPGPPAPWFSLSHGPGILPQDPVPLFTLPEARPESRAPPPHLCRAPGR